MGIVSGYICAACIFIQVAKFVTKRLGLKKDRWFLSKNPQICRFCVPNNRNTSFDPSDSGA